MHIFPYYYYRKQEQLWADGLEFYKDKGTVLKKAKPHEFGIYSLKQREIERYNVELAALTKCRPIENTTATTTSNNLPIMAKIKDRVRNISNKVDSMNINDHNLNTNQLVAQHDEEDKNKNKPAGRVEMLELDAADGDDDMYCEKNDQTQGDTLNQIKALRRKIITVLPPGQK